MRISVIIPAFNEALYLPATLSGLRRAAAECPCGLDVIVVDNASTDRTAEVSRAAGAHVVSEQIHNIGRVRNRGAAAAHGTVLVFLDADTLVPPHFLSRICALMEDPKCAGGTAAIVHRPKSRVLRLCLAAWRWIGRRLGMAQGAAQFCRASAFRELNGYDESQFMGEDVDFYWRLRKASAQKGDDVRFLDDVEVLPSPRRFDATPIWKTLLWTNPLFVLVFRGTRAVWAQWYVTPPR